MPVKTASSKRKSKPAPAKRLPASEGGEWTDAMFRDAVLVIPGKKPIIFGQPAKR